MFSTQTLNLTSCVAGDTLVIFYGSDYYTLANMPNVTSSAGTCNLVTSVDMGDNSGHMKAFLCSVGSSGTHTVTIPAHIDCDIHGIAMRVSGAVTADVYGSQFDPNNSSATHTAPSVTTTGTDRLLACGWVTPSGPAITGEPYTPQASMTKRGETDASPFSAMMVATEDIPSSGATGTRTATWVDLRRYGAITIALAGAGGGAAATAIPPSRRNRLGALLQL